jgi:hypothetical protein
MFLTVASFHSVVSFSFLPALSSALPALSSAGTAALSSLPSTIPLALIPSGTIPIAAVTAAASVMPTAATSATYLGALSSFHYRTDMHHNFELIFGIKYPTFFS